MAINECISKTQFSYVCERLEEICEKALAAKKEELTISKEHKVGDKEAAEIFLSKCDAFEIESNYYLHLALDFSPWESEEKYDKDAYDAFYATIKAEATDFKDRAMLCGAGDVLAELRAFEKKYLGE